VRGDPWPVRTYAAASSPCPRFSGKAAATQPQHDRGFARKFARFALAKSSELCGCSINGTRSQQHPQDNDTPKCDKGSRLFTAVSLLLATRVRASQSSSEHRFSYMRMYCRYAELLKRQEEEEQKLQKEKRINPTQAGKLRHDSPLTGARASPTGPYTGVARTRLVRHRRRTPPRTPAAGSCPACRRGHLHRTRPRRSSA
jgi:hypothetical protein